MSAIDRDTNEDGSGSDTTHERIAELEDMVRRLAERIYLAHEVIGMLAERKEVRGK